MQPSPPNRWPTLLAAVALVLLVGVVFFPIGGFEFIEGDVSVQVVHNPYIRELTVENLKHIFSSRCLTSYYPVRTLTYAVNDHFWGPGPASFKLTNGGIHLANVLLLFWLVLRLYRAGSHVRSPGAWWDASVAAFAAGVFAVHPVVVEPVTWVPGREELLMTLGALGCFHFHLTARRLGQKRNHARTALFCHVGAALCCAAACLSNALAAVIPLLITAWDLLSLPRPRFRKMLRGTAALWVIGAVTVVVKLLGERWDFVREQPGWFSAERLMLVLNVYWLNLKSLVWPSGLTLSYGWLTPESFLDADVILGAAALSLTLVILWKLRLRPRALFGLLWLAIALLPATQIVPHHIHRADRFLYLPLVGLMMAVAAGLRPLGSALSRRASLVGVVAAGVACLVVLDLLSVRQVRTWRNELTLWEHCVSVAPGNSEAHLALADELAGLGDFRGAAEHREIVMRMEFDNPIALNNLAVYLATAKREPIRDYGLAVRMAERACELTHGNQRDFLRTLAVARTELARFVLDRGGPGPAIQHYRQALEADPDYQPALIQLAFLLAGCSDPKLRDLKQAVRLAERASRLKDHSDPAVLAILSQMYADLGESELAVSTWKKAIALAEAAGNAELADEIRRRLRPGRDGPPAASPAPQR